MRGRARGSDRRFGCDRGETTSRQKLNRLRDTKIENCRTQYSYIRDPTKTTLVNAKNVEQAILCYEVLRNFTTANQKCDGARFHLWCALVPRFRGAGGHGRSSSGVSSKRRREESRVRTRPKPVATTSDCRLLLANDIARADAERDPLDRPWVHPTMRNKHHPTPPRWSDSACGVRPTADHGARKSVTLSKHNASGPRAPSDIARARWAAGACGA